MAASIVLEPCHNPTIGHPEAFVIASLRSVSKKFGQQIALDRLSLELRRGEVVALLGPNGAGKTTAVRLLLGLSQATSGEVRIFGGTREIGRTACGWARCCRWAACQRRCECASICSSSAAITQTRGRLRSCWQVAGLEGLEDKLFGTLSGGQKQRMLFALALCGDPDLICLDEPTTRYGCRGPESDVGTGT